MFPFAVGCNSAWHLGMASPEAGDRSALSLKGTAEWHAIVFTTPRKKASLV